MSFISIFICAIICVFYKLTGGSLRKPGFIMSLVFLVIQVASALRLYGLIEVREKIYFLCTLAVVFFVIGTALARKTRTNVITNAINFSINYPLVYSFIFIAIIVMIPYAGNIISTLRSYGSDGFLMIRSDAVSGEGDLFSGSSSMTFFLYDLIVQPLCFTLPPLVTADYLYGKKDKVLLIGTIVLVVVKTLFNFNRATLFYALLMCFIVYKTNGQKINLSKKTKRMLIVLGVVVIGAVYYITSMRVTMSLDKSIYKYLAGPLPNLDLRLDNIEHSGIYSMGFASLRGLYSKVWSILKSIGILGYPNWFLKMGDLLYVEESVVIGSGLNMNAFVTPIYSMYLDGRYFGVAIGMLLYGYFCEKTLIKVERSKENYRYDTVYALVILGVIFSFVRMQFSNSVYALGVLYAVIFTTDYLRLFGFRGRSK